VSGKPPETTGFGGAGASATWREEPIEFATERIAEEWLKGRLNKLTRLVVLDGARFASEFLGWTFILTCIWRSDDEDKALGGTGVHAAWRAVDVRTKNRPASDMEQLVAYLNGRYVYDPARPSKPIAYAREHGTGPHMHIQTHPNTIGRSFMRGA